MNRLFDRSRLIGSAVSAGLFLAFAWMLERLSMLVYDDAFIHLRIARNLALTGRAFWNPGERVMATSSPAWTILLAVSGMWKHRELLPWFEAFLLTASAVLAYRIARLTLPDTSARFPVAVLASVCTTLLLIPSAYAQMESPLAIVLLLMATHCFTRGSRWGLVWLAFAAMTRLEMLPLLGLAVLYAAGVRKVVDASLAAVAVIAGFGGFLFWQFGVLLPHSMKAKSISYAMHPADAFHQFFPPRLTGHAFLICLGCLAVALLADDFAANRRSAGMGARWLPAALLAWGVTVMLEYTVQSALMFDWYLPLIYVPLVLGLLLSSPWTLASGWLRGIVVTAAVFAFGYVMVNPVKRFGALLPPVMVGTPEAVGRFDGLAGYRVQQYLELGRMLYATCPEGRVMSPEIGGLGFGFEGHVDDAFGIASPQALKFQPLRSGASAGGIPAGYARAVHPDVIVGYDFLAAEVTNDGELMKSYRRTKLPTTMHAATAGEPGWMGSRSLDVLVLEGGRCDTALVTQALGSLRFQKDNL